jgi:hypothetical protein
MSSLLFDFPGGGVARFCLGYATVGESSGNMQYKLLNYWIFLNGKYLLTSVPALALFQI